MYRVCSFCGGGDDLGVETDMLGEAVVGNVNGTSRFKPNKLLLTFDICFEPSLHGLFVFPVSSLNLISARQL